MAHIRSGLFAYARSYAVESKPLQGKLMAATACRSVIPALAVFAVTCLFLFYALGSVHLLDPDEGMYGSIAREMAEGGDWITPHFDGVRYLHKPPLYFWLTALSTMVFGYSEWVIRLWSALPALGTAFIVWRLGVLLYGGSAGLVSALVMVSSVGVFRYSRVAATDFLLVFSLSLALYGWIKVSLSPPLSLAGRRWSLVFYLGMALGVLSKGLIGVVFPLLIVGLHVLMEDRWRKAHGINGHRLRWSVFSLPGLLLFLALVVPWHALAAWKNPGFFDFYIVDNQLLRFLNHRAFIEDDVPVSTGAFLILTLLWFFPWSLFLPMALKQGFSRLAARDLAHRRLRMVVGLWAVVVLGFFSLSFSKLEHYFLPAMPALSLMVGSLWSEVFASSSMGRRAGADSTVSGLRWSLGVGAVGTTVVGLGLLVFSDLLTPRVLMAGLSELNVYYRILENQGVGFPFSSVDPFVQILKGLGIVLAVGLPLALTLFYRQMPKASWAALLSVAGGIGILIIQFLFLIEPHHSTSTVADALATRLEPQDLIVHEGSLEYSGGLPFYTGKRIYLLNGKRGDLDFGSHYPESQYLFLDDAEFLRLWKAKERVYLIIRPPLQQSILRRKVLENVFPIGWFGPLELLMNHAPPAISKSSKVQWFKSSKASEITS